MTSSVLAALTRDLEPVGLADIPADLDLLERYDIKLAGRVGDLPAIMDLVGDRVCVLEVDGSPVAEVSTNYFDTPDSALFRAHAQRRRRRYKVRIRRYGEGSQGFLEVKAKTNRRQTVKYRESYQGWDTLDESARQFVADAVYDSYGVGAPDLVPRLSTHFQRSTLVELEKRERLTLDVEFVASVSDKRVVFRPDRVIVEGKSNRATPDLLKGLQRFGFREMPLSKYCMAITCGDPNLRGNEWTRAVRWFGPAVTPSPNPR